MGGYLTRLFLCERPLRHLPAGAAIGLLAVLMAVLAWSSVAVPGFSAAQDARSAAATAAASAARSGARPIGDFALYEKIERRVTRGEDYYAAAMDEQRANNYPTRPFVTVRLPTLARIDAALSPGLVKNAQLLLLLGIAGGFFVYFRGMLGTGQAAAGAVLVMLGGAGVMTAAAPYIHELAAGLLLSLAFVLYRTDRLWPSLLAAALALALRELALPFALLWLAFAAGARRWREAAAVGALIGLFAGGLYLHYLGVSAHALPSDLPSPGWRALAGPVLPLFALARMSGLMVLPLWLAGPLAVLPLVGWIGLGGRAGLFAALWNAGFLAAMALFARPENAYWVMLVLPLYFAGFAMLPRALADVIAAATGRTSGLANSAPRR